ncbi:MAG: LacI family DNA-binding transcriptional regulator [Candidatus Micrarchaeota archaeon]|nr:LacI family DNA-binding transcriptional regulator [Candidatus Micrarchaeota archaeon]
MAEINVSVLRNIRRAVKSGKKTMKEIAEKYGVSTNTVSRIKKMSDKEFENYIAKKKAAATKKKKATKKTTKKKTRACSRRR